MTVDTTKFPMTTQEMEFIRHAIVSHLMLSSDEYKYTILDKEAISRLETRLVFFSDKNDERLRANSWRQKAYQKQKDLEESC